MERLTNKNLTKACNDPWDYCGLDSVCARDCHKPEPCKIPRITHRLAEIEDILGDDYDLDRLRELVEADRDGRCVVYSKGFPIVSTYLQEGGLYIRETSGVIGYEEYNAALKGEPNGKQTGEAL